jgi:hypothetical protein
VLANSETIAPSAAGECAAVMNMLGVPPSILRTVARCAAVSPVTVAGSIGAMRVMAAGMEGMSSDVPNDGYKTDRAV